MRVRSFGTVKIASSRHSRDEVIRLLQESLPRLRERLPVMRVVLFGSYATGRAAVGSDIDVLVVYRGPEREDAFAAVHDAVPLTGLESHVYSEVEAERVSDVLERMVRDGLVLYEEGNGAG